MKFSKGILECAKAYPIHCHSLSSDFNIQFIRSIVILMKYKNSLCYYTKGPFRVLLRLWPIIIYSILSAVDRLCEDLSHSGLFRTQFSSLGSIINISQEDTSGKSTCYAGIGEATETELKARRVAVIEPTSHPLRVNGRAVT